MKNDNEIIERIKFNVIQGRVTAEDDGYDEGLEGEPATIELVKEALEKNIDVKELIVHGLTEGMNIVGRNFEEGVYLVPDMIASAEAVGMAMDLLSPYLDKAGIENKGKFLISTVKDDLHDIGKNIVSILIKGAGYEIIDLGTDVPTSDIVQAVAKYKPDYLGLSALLTTTMREMENVINALEKEKLRAEIKVLIGGAPTSESFAKSIGADLYCPDAFSALEYIKNHK